MDIGMSMICGYDYTNIGLKSKIDTSSNCNNFFHFLTCNKLQ